MSDSLEIEEIKSYRNRLVDLRQKSSETASSTIRTISLGLSLTIYGFVFSPSTNAVWQKYSIYFLLGAVCGVLSSLSDVLQSLYERKSAVEVLNFLRDQREAGATPDAAELEDYRSRHGGQIASFLLLKRAILALVGSSSIIVAVVVAIKNQ
ncbi:hypothetical protein [Methylobacterium sp. J-077]|uniref:hypothetical protein n=1 Tax=Methylobacterium sp. J-077 TaxID=2836656 RepID=UPI001FBA2E45|nr:hypothetical protein [Methylobacterium sp. J-077]MCJ2127228.1 hypothetical protein [Methylobacterium sp. J-077]